MADDEACRRTLLSLADAYDRIAERKPGEPLKELGSVSTDGGCRVLPVASL
jgi:hypothetical protein